MTQEEPSREVTGSPGAPVRLAEPFEAEECDGLKEAADLVDNMKRAETNGAALALVFDYRKNIRSALLNASQEPPVAGVRAAADAPNKG